MKRVIHEYWKIPVDLQVVSRVQVGEGVTGEHLSPIVIYCIGVLMPRSVKSRVRGHRKVQVLRGKGQKI